MKALHQFVPTFEPGAVGGHMLEVQKVVRGLGLQSEIFAEHVDARYAGLARDFRSYDEGRRRRTGEALLYQSAIGSSVADYLLQRPEPLLVNYHNITPPEYFAPWEPPVVHGLAWGRAQLRGMAARAAVGIADSGFNEQELVEAGYRRTTVAPVLVDVEALESTVDGAALARLQAAKRDGGADLLFVGRVAPNKCQHDLVKAFAVYRRVFDPHARLHVVGAPSSDTYLRALAASVRHLGLEEAVRLTGGVPAGVLAAHYRAADVFVCLSEHEGFCVPLLEAWHHGVPVVAFAAAAVPETLGGAGVLLPRKDPATVAAAVHRVVSDAGVRDALVTAGRVRLEAFSLERSRAVFEKVVLRALDDLP